MNISVKFNDEKILLPVKEKLMPFIHNSNILKTHAENLENMTSVLCIIQAAGMVPTDAENWEDWKDDARKIIDEASKIYDPMGISFLALAMLDIVIGENYSGKGNIKYKP